MSMGKFGSTLDQCLRDSGLEVYTSVTGGATPYYWLSDYSPVSSTIGHWRRTPRENRRFGTYRQVPKVETLIEDYDPDVVIVQTGTNMYATLRSKRRTEEANAKEVAYVYQKMCEQVTRGGRRCYWVTPPQAHTKRYPKELQNKMLEIIQDTVSPYGRVFDSYAVTKFTDPYPQTDGIHYGPTKAKAWAKDVAQDFIQYATDGLGVGRKALELDEATPDEDQNSEGKRVPTATIAEIGMEPVSLKIRLVAKSVVTDLSKVTYKRALGIAEYEVLKVHSGHYPFKRLRLAELLVENRKIQWGVVNRKIGGKPRDLTLVPLSKYPGLERLETVDDLEINFDLPLMITKL